MDNTRELACEDYKNGMSLADIASKYGLKSATVRQWAKRYWKGKSVTKAVTPAKSVTKKRDSVTAAKEKPACADKLIAEAVEENAELTYKQMDFCRFFMRNKNATQAYLKAYGCTYTTAMAEGYNTLRNPKIAAELKRLREIRDAALGLDGNDIVEIHMRIAFADITDFVEFENKEVPIMKNGLPVLTFDEDGGATEARRNINEVRLKNSRKVDGNIITEVSEGREGVKIKLADKQKSLAFLERYFEINPMDTHKKNYDNRVLAMKDREHEALHGMAETATHYNGLPANVIGKSYHEINLDIDTRKYKRFDFKGGRGGGRSSFCSLKLIDRIMLNPEFCALVVRAVKDTMRDSVYAQVVWAIEKLNLEHLFKCNVSPMQIVRKDTGQVIYFRGADEPGKIKSIKTPQGKYIAIVWAEEKDQIPGGAAWRNILQSAFRGGNVALEFNSYNTPISQQHYLNKEALVADKARTIHHGYYYDMPRDWLGDSFLEQAEHLKATDERAYRHEYLGEATGTGANVFENVKREALPDEFIATFDRIYLGIDWGYIDPAVFIACYFHAAGRKLYIFEEIAVKRAGNEDFAKLIPAKWKKVKITADSAEPKSVGDFKRYGFYINGAKKGAGSVDYGMKWLASLTEIIIDPARCPVAAEEFETYEYGRSKEGEIISSYPDKDNHTIDAVRYALEEPSKWGQKRGFV